MIAVKYCEIVFNDELYHFVNNLRNTDSIRRDARKLQHSAYNETPEYQNNTYFSDGKTKYSKDYKPTKTITIKIGKGNYSYPGHTLGEIVDSLMRQFGMEYDKAKSMVETAMR